MSNTTGTTSTTSTTSTTDPETVIDGDGVATLDGLDVAVIDDGRIVHLAGFFGYDQPAAS